MQQKIERVTLPSKTIRGKRVNSFKKLRISTNATMHVSASFGVMLAYICTVNLVSNRALHAW